MKTFPRPNPYRTFPLPASSRTAPLDPVDALRVMAGLSKRCLLGDRCYPFGELWVDPDEDIASIEYAVGEYQTRVIDAQIPIEILDYGIWSRKGSGSETYDRSAFYLDPDEFENTTYYLEIIAKNVDTADASVSIVNDQAETQVSLTVPAGTSDPTRFRSDAFAPEVGSTKYFLLNLSKTTVLNDLMVYSARLVCDLSQVTKGVVILPLFGQDCDEGSNGTQEGVDRPLLTTYSQRNPKRYGLWLCNLSSYATVSAVRFETCGRSDAGETAYAALFDATTGLQVTGAENAHAGSTITSVLTEIDTANLTEGHEYEVRLKRTAGSSCYFFRAALHIVLTDITEMESAYRYMRSKAFGTGSFEYQRILPELSKFSAGRSCYNEITALISDGAASQPSLSDADTADSGTTATALQTATPTTTKARYRSDAIEATDGDRYIAQNSAGAGTVTWTSGFFVVGAEAPETDLSWTALYEGDYPDLVTAARALAFAPTQFAAALQYHLRITDGDGVARTKTVDVMSDVRIAGNKVVAAGRRVRPFADATFATDADLLDSASYQYTGGAKTAITPESGETLIEAIGRLEVEFAYAGRYILTLFVTDVYANELSAVCAVDVK